MLVREFEVIESFINSTSSAQHYRQQHDVRNPNESSNRCISLRNTISAESIDESSLMAVKTEELNDSMWKTVVNRRSTRHKTDIKSPSVMDKIRERKRRSVTPKVKSICLVDSNLITTTTTESMLQQTNNNNLNNNLNDNNNMKSVMIGALDKNTAGSLDAVQVVETKETCL
jgi:membrane carboxypeptidase/penicillin-binding protein